MGKQYFAVVDALPRRLISAVWSNVWSAPSTFARLLWQWRARCKRKHKIARAIDQHDIWACPRGYVEQPRAGGEFLLIIFYYTGQKIKIKHK
jgi:hypothetical protein